MRAGLLSLCGCVASALGGGGGKVGGRFGSRLRASSSSTSSGSEASTSYATLKKQLREVSRLQEIEGILSYDEQVFMSGGSAASRAAQKETLAGVIHDMKTGAGMRAAVEGVRGLAFEDARVAANVREAVASYDKEARKSRDLAEREARLESETFVSDVRLVESRSRGF